MTIALVRQAAPVDPAAVARHLDAIAAALADSAQAAASKAWQARLS